MRPSRRSGPGRRRRRRRRCSPPPRSAWRQSGRRARPSSTRSSPPASPRRLEAFPMLYRGMDRAQLDAAYNNSDAVPTVDAIRADWDARSASVRQRRRGHLDLEYGDTLRQRLDLFLADSPSAPTLMFIHGGYWQRNDKERFDFVAEGPLA